MKLGLSQARIARIEKDPLNISVGQLLKVLTAMDARMSVTVDSKLLGLSVMSGYLNATEAGDTVRATGAVGSDTADKSNQGDW